MSSSDEETGGAVVREICSALTYLSKGRVRLLELMMFLVLTFCGFPSNSAG